MGDEQQNTFNYDWLTTSRSVSLWIHKFYSNLWFVIIFCTFALLDYSESLVCDQYVWANYIVY